MFLDHYLFLFTALIVGLHALYQFGRPKLIYFVRHGETILNAAHIRQDDKGGLSDKGKQQARDTGERLKEMHIQKFFCSPFERAKETAEIIRTFVSRPIEYTDLLAERRNPTEIVGKKYDDPEVVKIINLIDGGYHEDNLRYSDEENFQDLKDRAAKLLPFLEKQEEHTICCVTHGIYLKMILAYMLKREDLHAPEYVKLSFFNKADNAGITLCRYSPLKRFNATRGWEILAFSDESKLSGEKKTGEVLKI